MGAFFVYILKAPVYLAILYLFYSILLSKETFTATIEQHYNVDTSIVYSSAIVRSYGCSRNVFKHYYTRQSAGNILYRKRITKQNSDRYYRGTTSISSGFYTLSLDMSA